MQDAFVNIIKKEASRQQPETKNTTNLIARHIMKWLAYKVRDLKD
jgi:hypothetical protein